MVAENLTHSLTRRFAGAFPPSPRLRRDLAEARRAETVRSRGSLVSRREWLAGTLALIGGCASARQPAGTAVMTSGGSRSAIETVLGPAPAESLGVTLMHEHVLVDFIGADRVDPGRYDADNAFQKVLPHLQQVRKLGCETLVECTPAFLGRDPRLLARLSRASGVRILTNTGYYGAAKDKHLPRAAFDETEEQLARRWVSERERGIGETGIKPAFMKIGVDEGPLSEVDRKLVRAAARTWRETGMPIASHTSTGIAAIEELDELDRSGVPSTAFIWVHAQSERDETFHRRAARRGAWVEFDGISDTSVDRHVALVGRMKAEGLLGHTLVSHDAGWYRVGEPDGGRFRPYDTLFTSFVPALRASGFSEREVSQLLVENPRRALTGP
jgi:phosphotriesterase-related protein